MKLKKLEAAAYRVPLEEPLTDATHGEMTHFDLVLVRLWDSDGCEGVGYTYTVNHGGGAVLALLREDLLPLLQGADPRAIAALWEKLYWALHYVGRGGIAGFALSAVDIALWDLRARQQGLPLWRVLGGAQPAVAAYAGGIDLQTPLEALLEGSQARRAEGFRALKMKVGRARLREDVERVAAMRSALGAEFPLMADANMRWSRDEALRAVQALGEYGLFWLEEPLIPDDEVGFGRLAACSPMPLATGENLHTLYEFERMLRVGGVGFLQPDVSNCGGITAWLKIAALAESCGVRVSSHGVHDLHVHLLAAVPNASYLEVHGFGLNRFIAQPLVLREGLAQAPERPGHGVSFVWEALSALG